MFYPNLMTGGVTNDTRAGWAYDAVLEYAKSTGVQDESLATVLGDLLGDITHLIEAQGGDPETMLNEALLAATEHHAAETCLRDHEGDEAPAPPTTTPVFPRFPLVVEEVSITSVISLVDILAYLDELTVKTKHDAEVGVDYWVEDGDYFGDEGIYCGVCTNSAMLVANRFGGRVYGYRVASSDSGALIGHTEGGHDFAVVGDFLVDWWGKASAGGPAVLDMGMPDARLAPRYKDKEHWEEIPLIPLKIK